jgi:hypothetical protein
MKYLKSLAFLLFSLIIATPVTFSQEELTVEDRIRNEMSSDQINKILSADEIVAKANQKMEQVEEMDKEVSSLLRTAETGDRWRTRRKAKRKAKKLGEKARKQRIEAAELYEKGYKDIYLVYKEKLNEYIHDSGTSADATEAKKLISQAKNNFVEATKQMHDLKRRDSNEHVADVLENSHQLKIQGLDFLIEGLCLYIECYPKPVEPEEDTVKPVIDVDSLVVEDDTEELEDDFSKGLIFQVQIIALTKKLSPHQQKSLYPQGELIEKFDESDGLYKYRIGNFKTYDEAKQIKKNIGKDSFIVPLRDGERITIREALGGGH